MSPCISVVYLSYAEITNVVAVTPTVLFLFH
jgi:hypothetical protein